MGVVTFEPRCLDRTKVRQCPLLCLPRDSRQPPPSVPPQFPNRAELEKALYGVPLIINISNSDTRDFFRLSVRYVSRPNPSPIPPPAAAATLTTSNRHPCQRH